MYCSHCGTANPDGSDVKFCRSCGAELAPPAAVAGGVAPPGEFYATQPQVAFAPGAAYVMPTVGVPVQAAVFPYGGFWIRFVAYLIDLVIVAVAGGAVGFAFGIAGSVGRASSESITLWAQLLGFLVGLGYYVIMPPLAGATLGKVVLGYNIVGADGRRIGYGRALGRYLSYVISGLVIGLGFIWIGVDSYKQGWHDKIAGTFVVRKELVRP